ncbi:iron complex transport system substrate-binding protein [Murinocardiopsis flavida]|uniref:Iron complex transport system substrate-binding protein n=1 Tax=Murinocardiopsis flavida TaxID=645275 RepID=A0A2P8DEF4_9ACTN|nr:ABC transporter substrate-binding protein [Murinocardiopsis flavida]PSK95616.1 iron complex transport system substrate-binding protein [Murinocardiopsis flavida]
MRTRTALSVPIAALAAALTLSACGGGGQDAEPEQKATEGFPVTVEHAGGEQQLKIDAKPERIVSLSATATEMLFDIGAGEQVEAADQTSNFPEEAPTEKDLSAFTPSVEAITEFEPDLVVLSDDMDGIAAKLKKVKTPVLHLPAATTLDDTYEQMRTLGAATGHADEAEKRTGEIEERLTEIADDAKKEIGGEKLSYYHELDDQMFSITSKTYAGEVYGLFGLTNIADEAKEQAGGYPQLSAEFIVEQDPDLIVLSEGGDKAVEELEGRPAFDTIGAVENDEIAQIDGDLSSRWGPRVVDFAEQVSEAAVAAAEKN